MNKARRKAIEEIEVQLETLADRIGEIRDEEQDYLDNMARLHPITRTNPESLQASEVAEIAVSSLDESSESLEKALAILHYVTVDGNCCSGAYDTA